MIVQDFDRSVRTVTWDERRAIMRAYKPREIKSTKGSVPMDTFVDPDKIFDFDDPRVSRSFYYPDYSGNYPKMPIDVEQERIEESQGDLQLPETENISESSDAKGENVESPQTE